MSTPATDAQLDGYSKKQLIQHMQAVAPPEFVEQHRIGSAKPWEKLTKDQVVTIAKAFQQATGASAAPSEPGTAGGGAPQPKPAGSAAAGSNAQFSFTPAGDTANLFAAGAGAPTNFKFNFDVGAPPADADDDDEGKPRRNAARGAKGEGAKGGGGGGGGTAGVGAQLGALTVSGGTSAAEQARLKALRALQQQQDEAKAEYERKRKEIEREYQARTGPLAAERKGIVSGATAVEGDPAGGSGIPHFWLSAMMNHRMLEREIMPPDAPILKHLVDVSLSNELPEHPGREGFRLLFEFSPNEYFSNGTLSKTYVMDEEDEDTLDNVLGCEIHWKPGKDVTKRTVTKKQKKKGKERTITVNEPLDSWFTFFSPPEVPDDDAELDEMEAEALQDALEGDYEMAQAYKDKLIPNAVQWYTGARGAGRVQRARARTGARGARRVPS